MTRSLLTLTQWLSPAFPLGAFAYSHGLEHAIAAGIVTDPRSLERWVADLVLYGSAQSDAVLLVHVLCGGDPDAAATLAEGLAGSSQRLSETREMGAAFAATLSDMTGDTVLPRPLPVALGLAARELRIPEVTVAMLFLQSFAANQVSCAQRAVPIGQSAAQAVLHRLSPVITDAAQQAAHGDPSRIALSTFGADLAAMAHETLQPRMFRS